MKKNGFALLIIILVIAILGVVGYLSTNFFKKQGNTSQTSNKVEGSTPDPSLNNETQSIDSEYTNQKYNFKLKYESKYIFEGKTESTGQIEENGNQIIYRYTRLRDNFVTEKKYTIYDANKMDRDNLVDWWKANVKTDTEVGTVPNDYEFDNNIASLIPDPNRTLQHWDNPPPGFYIHLNDEAVKKISDNYESFYAPLYSVYVYYDFGKPFVVNFTTGNTGAGGSMGILSTMEKLQ